MIAKQRTLSGTAHIARIRPCIRPCADWSNSRPVYLHDHRRQVMEVSEPPLEPRKPSRVDPKLHPPPSRAQVFAALTSAPISTPPSPNDTRVSLRTPWPPIGSATHVGPSHSLQRGTTAFEPCTLSAFRETEGSAKRLTKFRQGDG